MKSLYELLGVERDATTDEIRKAYRNLAKFAHPDVGGDKDEFAALAEACDVLCDPEQREKYDRIGKHGQRVPLLEDEALEVLLTITAQSIEQSLQMATINLKEGALQAIDMGLQQIETNRRQLLMRVGHMEKFIKRLVPNPTKMPKKEDDRMTPRLTAMLASLNENVERTDHSKRVHERAREIIQQYDWDDVMAGSAGTQQQASVFFSNRF